MLTSPLCSSFDPKPEVYQPSSSRLFVIAYEDIPVWPIQCADSYRDGALQAQLSASAFLRPAFSSPASSSIWPLCRGPNSAYVAMDKALADLRAGGFVTRHLRDGHYAGSRN